MHSQHQFWGEFMKFIVRRYCSDEVHMECLYNVEKFRALKIRENSRPAKNRFHSRTKCTSTERILTLATTKYAQIFFTNYKSWTPFLLSVEILFYFLWQLPPHRSLKFSLRFVQIIFLVFFFFLNFSSSSLLFSW